MKKLSFIFFMLTSLSLNAQTYIKNWGATGRGNGWPILNDSRTVAGNASMGADEPPQSWATIRGSFGQTIEATSDEAIIVSGHLEFVGAGPGESYFPLRYALTYQEDEGMLEHQYTDSAAWSVTGGHYGYEFTPGSGADFPSSGADGRGKVWTIVNGNWNSTWSNNGRAISHASQVPSYAVMPGGVYNWAISVQPLDDSTNEVRWYLVHEDKVSYWFGGTAIDTALATTKFKGICFGIGNDIVTDITHFNLSDVRVEKGIPIEVPPAPWQKYYIDHWGLAEFHGWPILNDSTTIAGNASIGAEIRDGVASLRGSFGQDVEISTEKAIIIRGQIEFIGGSGGDDFFPIRYAITYQPDEGELLYVGTDSMQWSTPYLASGYYGYAFHPRTGTGTMSNGNGGVGTVWAINNGNWVSTWNGGCRPIAAINQAPRNAEIVAGVYDLAISVIVINDTTNAIRWYMVEQNMNYWFGGSVEDIATTNVFNGVEFGINGGEYTQFNVTDMSVDLGDPIADFYPGPTAFYIEQWGILGNRFGGWTLTPGELAGNISISGDAANTDMTAIRGEFFEPVAPSDGSALIIDGELELEGGGFEAANSLRFGVFYGADAGQLITQPPDSMHWAGSEAHHSGYLFIPPSATHDLAAWGAEHQSGSWGAVVNNVWFEPQSDSNYALGGGFQYPAYAIAGAGTYNFEISILTLEGGNREIRFKLIKNDATYGFAGIAIDEHDRFDTDYFSCISFALDSGNTTTAFHLRDVKIDKGEPITLPEWITTGVQPKNSIPTKYALSQNFPNPFNPTTHIRYSLPKLGNVSLKVYNLLGQEIVILVEGKQDAGNYTIEFNAANLPGGVYLYRLKTNEFTETKKLILIK